MLEGSAPTDQLLNGQTDILGDLPQERRCYVAALVQRDRRPPAVRVAQLDMRSLSPDFNKSERLQPPTDFQRLQNRERAHRSITHRDALRSHELGLQLGLPVFQKHLNDFPQIGL
jgi:hypothetical protein